METKRKYPYESLTFVVNHFRQVHKEMNLGLDSHSLYLKDPDRWHYLEGMKVLLDALGKVKRL